MRIVLIIFGIIFLLSLTLGGLLLTASNNRDAEEMEMVENSFLGGALSLAREFTSEDIPTAAEFRTAMVFALLTAVFGIVGIVGMFLKGIIRPVFAGLVVLSCLLLVFMQPGMDGSGDGEALDPRTVAWAVFVLGVLGAACILGIHAIANKKAAAQTDSY